MTLGTRVLAFGAALFSFQGACQTAAMPSKIETQALLLIDALYAATGGRPGQWRALVVLRHATDEVVQHAIDQGWVIVEGGHSVCLTDHGLQRAKS